MVDKKIDIGKDNSGIANSGDNNTIQQTNHINKKYFLKASNLTIVGVGLLVVVGITLSVSNSGINRSFNNISDSNITVNNGINDKTLQMIMSKYEQEVNNLKAQLEKAPSLEVYQELYKAQKELAKKTQELATLQQTINTIKPSDTILNQAKKILDTKGTSQAIKYLQGEAVKQEKEQVDKANKNLAKSYQLQAQLLIVENRYDEAKEAYEKMTQYDRSFDALFEYALFLQNQNHFREAIKGYENLLDLKLSQEDRARTLNNLAVLYSDQNQHQKALKAYQEALNIRRDLAKANPSVYNPYVANTLNNLAILYKAQNQNQEALNAYQEALKLRRDLAKANPSVYNPDVADTLNNLAILYKAQNQNQEALNAYQEALTLYRDLAQANPSVYNPDVAMTLNNLAILYSDQNQNQEALQVYQEALKIRRDLAQANPSVYNPDVAMTLNNLANLYSDQNQNKEALQAYQEALNIRRDLAQANPSVYNPDVATTLNNLAILYSDQNQHQEALKAYQEALTLYRDLAQTNPRAYELYYAKILIIGVDYLKQDKKGLEEAKKIVTQKHYRDVYWAQQLLKWIEEVESR